MKTINASDFKARCLAILDDVHESGERVVILKRGRPVAVLVCPSDQDRGCAQAELDGTVEVIGDVVNPVLPEEYWDVLKP